MFVFPRLDTNLWLQEKLNDLEKTKHRLGIDEHNDIDTTRHFIRQYTQLDTERINERGKVWPKLVGENYKSLMLCPSMCPK